MRGLITQTLLLLTLVSLSPGAAGAGGALRVKPVSPPQAPRLGGPARVRGTAISPADARIEQARAERWRSFRDVLSSPGMDWGPPVTYAHAFRAGNAAARAFTAAGPETIHVAMIRIDFLADRGVDQSTGDGKFDLTGPDTLQPPIDRPPHNRSFYQSHAEALRRFYDVQSYGRVVVESDVWPRTQNGAYSVSDMADFGPWTFGQSIYRSAVDMFRTMMFAADSQSVAVGDRIPWDHYDRIVLIHAGSDLQSDVRRDSKEDIPSFTIGVQDSDVIVFPDSANRPIDRASIVPEHINQDGYYGAINGVLAHECGHLMFNFADLYNIDSGFPVVGYWSLMDSGNQVGSIVVLPDSTEIFATGLLPPSVDPFQRSFIGDGLRFAEVPYGDPIAIQDGERHADMRRVTLSSDEYLLIENRYLAPSDSVELDQDSLTRVVLGPKKPDRYQYDALLPGSGLLVWHIDESVIPLETYLPVDTALRANPDYGWNTNPTRLGVSVVEADGLGDLGDPGSPFLFGAPFDPFFKSNYPTLSDTTAPSLIPHIGTRPHTRLEFLDDPDSVMHLRATRTWQRRGWPVTVDFPPGGPQILPIDADGDGKLDVCWAGGAAASPDSNALFAVRPDGTGLAGPGYAFAHLDRRPRPEMAAIATGAADPLGGHVGPSLFAVSTLADSADLAKPGGRVWLVDHAGVTVPGWPAVLPAIVTTPPVIAGEFPDASVYVGCADGRVYRIALDGSVLAHSDPPLAGGISGTLAVDPEPLLALRTPVLPAPVVSLDANVAAGGGGGQVSVIAFGRDAGNQPRVAATFPNWPVTVGGSGFAPDFLWMDFNGAPHIGSSSQPTVACDGGRSLVVHSANRVWAYCLEAALLPGFGTVIGDTLVAGLGAGDPDGDGYPEVLVQSQRSEVGFVNVSGRPSPGWPRRATQEDFPTHSPALALDVDGDGRSEVITLNASGILSALRADTHTPDGWPLATGLLAAGGIALADLDRSGTYDLVAPDRFGKLYAYTLPVTTVAPALAPWTMTGGDPGRTGALPTLRTPVAPNVSSGPLVHGSLKAYPNPARRHPVQFAYQLTEPAEIEYRIVDTSGHQVASFTRSGRPSDNLDVWEPGSLPAGLYVARVRFRGATSERIETISLGLLR